MAFFFVFYPPICFQQAFKERCNGQYLSENIHVLRQINATFAIHWSQWGSLCCGCPVFTIVNRSFCVAHQLSDASGLSVIEILLTVQGALPVYGVLSFFFQNEIMQPAACSDGEWIFFLLLFIVCVHICLCWWVGACLCVSEEHPPCACVFFL